MRNFKPTKMSFSVQEIAYLALLVAASVVGRTLFQPLPNVQPMTAIFLLVALYLCCVRGLIVALLSLLITNFYMGMGIWMIAQAVSYTVVILMMSGLRHVPIVKRSLILQVIFSILAGFLYGFVVSLLSVYLLGLPSFWGYYLQGISFDTLHAVGNGFFYGLLAPIFRRLFHRYYPAKKLIY
ncbi:ECF transporter S component [Enterococcus gallinarum]|uniref:ECF transporter S component n=1 Tax=Enterococcus gallinarum TaxID=1353 RepID=UPI0022E37512|nr:ECF transporter S component [Enterococcus gallinarum]